MASGAAPHAATHADLADHLARQLSASATLPHPLSLCVALSGGLDSRVLLQAAVNLREREPQVAVRAIHIDHGLQAAAAEFRSHCERAAQAGNVPLEIIAVTVDGRATGLEAAARTARYAAFAAVLRADEVLLTAHHQDDQAETLLLQLLRGAGVAGLAAMPARAAFGQGWHLRPFLDLPRSSLRDYAKAQSLEWVEDPMNADPRHDRVYLRRQILPQLRARWPAATRALARSSLHLGAAQEVLDSAAERHCATLLQSGTLDCNGLLALATAERANVLRYWLRGQGFRSPATARLAAIVRDVLPSGPAATPLVELGDGAVRRYRGRLYATRAMPPVAELPVGRELTAQQPLELGPLGTLRLERSSGVGLDLDRVCPSLSVRWRSGGELLRTHAGGPRRELRKLLQEAAIVPWMRGYLPLFYRGGDLLAVADLWIDADWSAGSSVPGWHLVWERRPLLQ